MMMNLADPELELIDPTPNIHAMFLHFDKTFFWAKLSSRCVVRWSKRMFSCAGTCTYEGGGGLCDIAVSEPLLKLRPRKDLVETLLHEMIHAYLFVTKRDQDRDGHGPNFQAHMHRINRAAGVNITIYHDFHDEVKVYQTHVWRCNGPCQSQKPYFGIVRRTNNRAPGPSDFWWKTHQRLCGGIFIKIKEPDKPEKKTKKTNTTKSNPITKYINTNNNNDKDAANKNIPKGKREKPVLKDSNNVHFNPQVGIKTNNSSTLLVRKKSVVISPQTPKSKPVVFNGKGHTIATQQPGSGESKNNSSVLETVRNVWSNKQIGTINNKQVSKDNNSTILSNRNKHKADFHSESPPPKIKKIDDYFKTAATSVLKDLYGQDFNITQSKDYPKLKAIQIKNNFVECPICKNQIDSGEINRHLDECLNKDLVESLSKESIPIVKNESYTNIKNVDNSQNDECHSEEDVIIVSESGIKKEIILKGNKDAISRNVIKPQATNSDIINLTGIGFVTGTNVKRSRTSFDEDNLRPSEQIKSAIDKKNSKLRNSDSFIRPTTSNIVQTSSILNQPVKIQPSSSKSDTTVDIECLCCGDKLNKSVDEHLDECLSFFEVNTSIPEEGASTSYEKIDIDDDIDQNDEFDETQTFSAPGTKLPCPCCLKMVEVIDMNSHLDECLGN